MRLDNKLTTSIIIYYIAVLSNYKFELNFLHIKKKSYKQTS